MSIKKMNFMLINSTGISAYRSWSLIFKTPPKETFVKCIQAIVAWVGNLNRKITVIISSNGFAILCNSIAAEGYWQC